MVGCGLWRWSDMMIWNGQMWSFKIGDARNVGFLRWECLHSEITIVFLPKSEWICYSTDPMKFVVFSFCWSSYDVFYFHEHDVYLSYQQINLMLCFPMYRFPCKEPELSANIGHLMDWIDFSSSYLHSLNITLFLETKNDMSHSSNYGVCHVPINEAVCNLRLEIGSYEDILIQ